VLVLIALAQPAGRGVAWRAAARYAAAACVCALLYSLAPVSGTEFLPKNDAAALAWNTPRTVLAVAGFILAGNPWAAAALGGAAVVVGALLSVRTLRVGGPAVIWAGMWLYSVAAITLMASGRTRAFEVFGTTQFSRYASLAALLWVSVVAMALMTVEPIWPLAVLVGCAALATTVAGQRHVDQQEHKRLPQEELALSIRVGIADGSHAFVFTRFPDLTERLRSIHHYPFNGDFTRDCGLFGTTITAKVTKLPRTHGELTSVGPAPLATDGISLRGWVDTGQPVRCVVVIDSKHRVVGTGLADAPTPERVLQGGATKDRSAGLVALARRTSGPYRVVVGSRHNGPLREVQPPP
jgi:hypothetical protein